MHWWSDSGERKSTATFMLDWAGGRESGDGEGKGKRKGEERQSHEREERLAQGDSCRQAAHEARGAVLPRQWGSFSRGGTPSPAESCAQVICLSGERLSVAGQQGTRQGRPQRLTVRFLTWCAQPVGTNTASPLRCSNTHG